MATTTPNYGWDVPTSTDYVKDGATAIETLGDDIDATLYTALGGAYPGMRLIKKQTIGSGVSSVAVTNAFSATYENYLIKVSGGSASTTTNMGFILTGQTSGYQFVYLHSSYGATPLSEGGTNASSFQFAGAISANGLHLHANISQPFMANMTRFNFEGAGTTGNYIGNTQGNLNNTTSYTGFTISAASGTMTGGTIYVYGYGAS
jgi:hypothetical protein